MPRISAGFLIVTLPLWPVEASATAYCIIGKVKTGFVALREQPSPKGTLLAKIKAGEEVRLGQETKGKWVKVDYWAKGRFPNGEKAEVPPTHTGWAHSALVGKECG